MRGYASVAVMLFHLGNNIAEELSRWMPQFILTGMSFGYVGVPVFFVISGFAMAASVHQTAISRGFFGNFVLRRSIRLDPPYWVSIVLGLVLLALKNYQLGGSQPMPSIGTLVAHVFYVQSFFGVPAKISGVYWTLCQEVQLYLAFILFIWIAQSLTRKYVSLTAQLTMWIMMAVGVLSLLFDYQLVPRPGVIDLEGQSIDRIDALFFRYWHYFLIGVLAEKFLRRAPWGVQYFVFWMILEIAFRLGCKFEDTRLIAYTLTAIATGMFLFAAIKLDRLDRWFTDPISQYLGRISYSLYLVHSDLGWKVISLGKSKLDPNKPLNAILIFTAAIAVAMVVSHIIHWLVEKPAMRLSNRFKKEWPLWTSAEES